MARPSGARALEFLTPLPLDDARQRLSSAIEAEAVRRVDTRTHGLAVDGALDGERFHLRVRSADRPRSPVELTGTLSATDRGTLVLIEPGERGASAPALDVRSTSFRILLAALLVSSAVIALGPAQAEGGTANLVTGAAPWVAGAIAFVVLVFAATWQKTQRPADVEARSHLEAFVRAALPEGGPGTPEV
jgi:hypothetical protein